jgi:pyroglutamyl-peptidase
MHRIATHPVPGLRGGFIHIPYLPEQAARFPGALRIAVATALAVKQDVAEPGGQLH